MNSPVWPITEFAALGLEPSEREAVLGDLTETGETGFTALQGVLGLVLRRQAPLWRTWPPWLAGFGVALPACYLLMGVSASISCTFERLYHPEIARAHWPTGHEGVFLLLCHVLLLSAWSWTAGCVSGLLSRRTAWATAGLSTVPFFFDNFHIYPLPKLCVLLFVLPLLLGVRHGLRAMPVRLPIAVPLAIGVSALMAFCWDSGALWIFNWALLLPAWYLVALAQKPHERVAPGDPHPVQS